MSARFEVFTIGREFRLTAYECWLLVALSLLADKRSGTFVGTIHELAEETRMTRRAVAVALKGLAAARLIAIQAEFRPGPGHEGEVKLNALYKLSMELTIGSQLQGQS